MPRKYLKISLQGHALARRYQNVSNVARKAKRVTHPWATVIYYTRLLLASNTYNVAKMATST